MTLSLRFAMIVTMIFGFVWGAAYLRYGRTDSDKSMGMEGLIVALVTLVWFAASFALSL